MLCSLISIIFLSSRCNRWPIGQVGRAMLRFKLRKCRKSCLSFSKYMKSNKKRIYAGLCRKKILPASSKKKKNNRRPKNRGKEWWLLWRCSITPQWPRPKTKLMFESIHKLSLKYKKIRWKDIRKWVWGINWKKIQWRKGSQGSSPRINIRPRQCLLKRWYLLAGAQSMERVHRTQTYRIRVVNLNLPLGYNPGGEHYNP